MTYLTTISKTDLARRTRHVVDRVRRGDTLIVESYGEEQIAMVAIIEYRILRAVAAYNSAAPHPAPVNGFDSAQHQDPSLAPQGLTEAELQQSIAGAAEPPQARWNEVLRAYLDGHISLGRAADLLALSRFELEQHFQRLDVPRRIGPETIEEAQNDKAALLSVTDNGAMLSFTPYRYLRRRPETGRQQLYLTGRTMTVGQLIYTMRANALDAETAAEDLDLPVEQVREALAYYETHRELIENETEEDKRVLEAQIP